MEKPRGTYRRFVALALGLAVAASLTPAADIMRVIRYTADDVNRSILPGRDDRVGYGRINMERALAPYILR
jgi:hypothetical protein